MLHAVHTFSRRNLRCVGANTGPPGSLGKGAPGFDGCSGQYQCAGVSAIVPRECTGQPGDHGDVGASEVVSPLCLVSGRESHPHIGWTWGATAEMRLGSPKHVRRIHRQSWAREPGLHAADPMDSDWRNSGSVAAVSINHRGLPHSDMRRLLVVSSHF